jgi:hypothetical protein
VTFERQRTGARTFDYATGGVAHYGLYADWLADLKRTGGDAIANDLWNGAEAYLQMWERAEGISSPACAPAHGTLTRRGLGGLRLGATPAALLRRAGQPQQRSLAWSWCVQGTGNERAADVAVLSRRGRVQLAASTAAGRRAGGAAVGARMRNGLHVRGRYVYDARGGRVRTVAVATRGLSRDRRALRAALRLVRSAEATQAPRAFTPNSTAGVALTGRPLAATGSPRTDAALTLLCGLLSA